VCTLAFYSLTAVRNRIVSGEFVTGPTGGGITLRSGNEPPAGVNVDPGRRKAFYDRIGAGGYTAEVIEYALTAPGPFAANLGRKALFAVGIYEPYAEGWGYSPVYLAAWISGLWGVAVMLRRGTVPVPASLPLLIAVTQFIAVVVVYPKGERLILPIHTMLIPYSAIAAEQLWRFIVASPAPPAPPLSPS
jgi:hypothetical protein